MRLRFKSLTGVLVLVVVATSFTSAAIAEPASSTQPSSNETISEAFNRAFFKNEPNFYRTRSFGNQIDLIFGLRSFPDQKYVRDAEAIERLYQDTLDQQTSSDPILRTPDLPNPYETSILGSSYFNPNQLPGGSQ